MRCSHVGEACPMSALHATKLMTVTHHPKSEKCRVLLEAVGERCHSAHLSGQRLEGDEAPLLQVAGNLGS